MIIEKERGGGGARLKTTAPFAPYLSNNNGRRYPASQKKCLILSFSPTNYINF